MFKARTDRTDKEKEKAPQRGLVRSTTDCSTTDLAGARLDSPLLAERPLPDQSRADSAPDLPREGRDDGEEVEGPLSALASPREPDPGSHSRPASAPGAQPNGAANSGVNSVRESTTDEFRERVHVSIRLRPLNEREVVAGDQEVWSVEEPNKLRCLLQQPDRAVYPSTYHFGTPTPAMLHTTPLLLHIRLNLKQASRCRCWFSCWHRNHHGGRNPLCRGSYPLCRSCVWAGLPLR